MDKLVLEEKSLQTEHLRQPALSAAHKVIVLTHRDNQ